MGKAESQRSDLAREIDQLGTRLDEASGATTAQVELNKKREAEVQKLRKDVEEANIQQESILANLKRKQGDAIAEMSEQIDALGKMKSKIEKDKVAIMNEISDARAATDEVLRAQASTDAANKKMVETLNATNKKVDNANLTLGDYASSKNKIAWRILICFVLLEILTTTLTSWPNRSLLWLLSSMTSRLFVTMRPVREVSC